MFAFALAASADDGVPNAERVEALMGAHGVDGSDGCRTAVAAHAAAAVRRWEVVARDESTGPTWDAARGLLFAGDVRLYNRPELISDLGEPPALLTTCSDLELARLAFLKWHHEAPSHLVGDFAFAAWEEKARRLFAARDHFGVRPLHFQVLPDGIAVASDVRQLLPLIDRSPDDLCGERILDGLLHRPSDLHRTHFRTISRVPPGCAVVFENGSIAERRYWTAPSPAETRESYADTCARLRLTFERAVRDRLESDRAIVAHSSGGFDSSTIIMAADQIYRSEPGRPPLTMASAVAPGHPSDESNYMDAVAARVAFSGARWNVVEDGPPSFPGVYRGSPLLRHGLAGGPRRDLELARDSGARVLLSGVLGDGIWHATGVHRDMVRHGRWIQVGYDILRRGPGGAARRFVDAGLGLLPPAPAARVAERLFQRRLPPPGWLGPALRSIYSSTAKRDDRGTPDWPSHLLCGVWGALTHPRSSRVVDAFVEYASEQGVELRAPYADVRLAEAVLSIPWRQREPHGHHRRLGRDALGPTLPPEFSKRIGQASWTSAWAATARRTAMTIAPLIQRGPWRSAAFVDRGIARAMLEDVLSRQDPDRPEVAILVTDFGALEAWLRQLFG